MGATDGFLRLLPRGLNSEDAMTYLGVRRRTWDALRGGLKPVKLGTALVYDIRDLDALFDRLKGETHALAGGDMGVNAEVASTAAASGDGGQLAPDKRPGPHEKGERTWAAKPKASTGMPGGSAGKSTRKPGAHAFAEALALGKKRTST